MATVKLDWVDGVSGETGFEIWRSTGSGFGVAPYATVGAGVVTYTDPTPIVGSNLYKVRGVNGAEATPYTANVTAVVPAIAGTVSGLTATVLA